jgi:hypothetical protein
MMGGPKPGAVSAIVAVIRQGVLPLATAMAGQVSRTGFRRFRKLQRALSLGMWVRPDCGRDDVSRRSFSEGGSLARSRVFAQP